MSTTTYIPRMQTKYNTEVIPALMKKFGYKKQRQITCFYSRQSSIIYLPNLCHVGATSRGLRGSRVKPISL